MNRPSQEAAARTLLHTAHYTTHFTALHCTALHCTVHYTLHCTVHYTLHCTALHCTLHSALHCTALYTTHCPALYCTLHTKLLFALHNALCTAYCSVPYTMYCTLLYPTNYHPPKQIKKYFFTKVSIPFNPLLCLKVLCKQKGPKTIFFK